MDAKLQSILLDYGATGYGLYWYCVELIAKDIAPNNITFELEHDARIIAKNLNLSVQEVTDMMQKMIDVGLFDISLNKKIRCIKLAYRLDDSIRKGAHVDDIINKFNLSRENPEKSRKIPKVSGKVPLEVEEEVEEEEKKIYTSIEFDDFYKAYPKKEDRVYAEKAWKKINDKEKQIILEDIEKRKIHCWHERKFIPKPSTYLNGKRWLDEIIQDSKTKEAIFRTRKVI